MNTTIQAGCSPTSIAVGLMLEALGAADSYDTVIVPGLPGHTIYVPEREAIIASTTAPPPLFRAPLSTIAGERHVDVVLLRLGEFDGEVLPVSIDFALGSLPCAVWMERDFSLYRDAYGSWLVPAAFGPTVSVGREGFNLEIVPPYASLAERAAGIDRSERDLARLLQPLEVR